MLKSKTFTYFGGHYRKSLRNKHGTGTRQNHKSTKALCNVRKMWKLHKTTNTRKTCLTIFNVLRKVPICNTTQEIQLTVNYGILLFTQGTRLPSIK